MRVRVDPETGERSAAFSDVVDAFEAARDEGCRMPCNGPSGFGSASMVVGPHDWRLIEALSHLNHETGLRNVYGYRWYCTRCRRIEDTNG